MEIADIIKEVERARGNPMRLEELYRTMTREQEHEFRKAMIECVRRYPDDVLYRAWELRLEARREKGRILEMWLVGHEHVWVVALLIGIMLGLLSFMIAQGSVPYFKDIIESAINMLRLRAP